RAFVTNRNFRVTIGGLTHWVAMSATGADETQLASSSPVPGQSAGQSAGQRAGQSAGHAPGLPAVADIDLAAIRANVAALDERVGAAEVMAVVKADAYGHGLVPCAQAALAGGATWLGVAQLAEGLTLRRAGVGGRLLSWLHVPGDDFT